jgi:hypothetical protein
VDKYQRELANRLFATATAILEDATEPAIKGQSWRMPKERLLRLAEALGKAGTEIVTIAAAIQIVVSGNPETRRRRA